MDFNECIYAFCPIGSRTWKIGSTSKPFGRVSTYLSGYEETKDIPFKLWCFQAKGRVVEDNIKNLKIYPKHDSGTGGTEFYKIYDTCKKLDKYLSAFFSATLIFDGNMFEFRRIKDKLSFSEKHNIRYMKKKIKKRKQTFQEISGILLNDILDSEYISLIKLRFYHKLYEEEYRDDFQILMDWYPKLKGLISELNGEIIPNIDSAIKFYSKEDVKIKVLKDLLMETKYN